MWSTSSSLKTKASKQIIWQLWQDVNNWKVWDHDVAYSQLYGQFEEGTEGIIKTIDGPEATFTIQECKYFYSFTSQTKMPLCKMLFIHSMYESGDEIMVIHELQITGPLSFIFSSVIGKKLKKSLPVALKNLVALAEREKN